MGTSAGASSGRRTPPGVTPEESSLPQGFMPTTTRRGLHSTAGTLRAVRGALVALFFLRGRARGLVFGARGHFVLYAAPTSHGAYTACCRPLPPGAAAAYALCSGRALTGASTG